MRHRFQTQDPKNRFEHEETIKKASSKFAEVALLENQTNLDIDEIQMAASLTGEIVSLFVLVVL